LYIDRIRATMSGYGKTLDVSDTALSALARAGFSLKYGARFLKRFIDDKVKMPITLRWKESDRFFVEEVGGEVAVITQKVPA
jgi:ATP-dependent Clp protease ATP-binding subunit ClpA